MHKILFICHGNICRSVMAEFVFKQLAAQTGLSDCFEIDSAATSTEEIGNPIYPQALQCLRHHGIAGASHSARQVTKADYDYFDQLILMENYNLRNLRRIIPSDPEGKVSLLLSHVAPNRLEGRTLDVADPWYTRDFETAYNDILLGCQALLDEYANAR